MGSPAAEGSLSAQACERFRTGLAAIWPEGIDEPEAKLGLAVSGGPDSLALLLLGHAALPGRVEAATVDHGLRAEAADEAAEVARVCAGLGVPHATLPVVVSEGNVQAEARLARYAAMADWVEERGLAALATAHQADDQAETLLMRLNRASGVAGLAGARARGRVPGTPIPLLRPVLDWRRAELGEVVRGAGLVAAEDPSNADDRFDRVRIRKALADADWLDVAAVARSAAHIAEADLALEWMADLEWRSCVKKEPMGLRYRPQAPRAVALRVVGRIVRELDGEAPRGGAVARLFDALVEGQPASIGNLVARPNAGGWSFAKAPVRAAKRKG
ncbi:tRNA lysidine(34) synthetase TilS [Novosphingobium mangrovi (ex Huang et al. 2023)]|uniref:tRNA(Ile)-lysidine synthase n=1 Tax=Novosphingobium mangrovi (ex Huang et al. 2023) TaxID=2976432 RepID=A0ABT2HZF1_9SPHN|nr:tRNA lysidine(34) synthetase TilS [Novosphingobium mangrovi (ex Huang et al. 2023)]MCT2397930.1 tRNA lysidine(34) synthetase TilS [Novosphingobium mangrovi (ex Huang et al. 2023)]